MRRRLSFGVLLLATTLGYATHGLLDACTTYGTQLFWTFSSVRVAWNNVSVVDPLFTLPLLALVVAAALKKKPRLAQIGLAWALFCLGLGAVQHERAEAAGRKLAHSRGHKPVRLEAKPSFGNLVLWKLVYEAEGRFYVDAARVTTSVRLFEGSSVEKLDPGRHFPGLSPGTVQHRDIERFTWFSNGYVALHPTEPGFIGDIRYSFLPHEIDPLWGIRVDPTRPDEHVALENLREQVAQKRAAFLRMLFLGEVDESASAPVARRRRPG